MNCAMRDSCVPRSVPVLCLLIGLAVPAAALALDVVDNNQHVALRFAPSVVLPPSCASRTLFGFDCPACGLTRSIIFLAHGRVADSFAMHRLGWLVFAMILLQIPYRIGQLWGREPFGSAARAEPWIWGLLVVLMLANRAWDLLIAL